VPCPQGWARKLQDRGVFVGDQYNDLERAYTELDRKIQIEERAEKLKESANEAILPMPYRERSERHEQRDLNPFDGIRVYNPGELPKRFIIPEVGRLAGEDRNMYFRRGLNLLPDQVKMRLLGNMEVRRTLQSDQDILGGFLLMDTQMAGQTLMDLHDQVYIMGISKVISMPNANFGVASFK